MKTLVDSKTGEILAFIGDNEQHLFENKKSIKILNLQRTACPHCKGAGWVIGKGEK